MQASLVHPTLVDFLVASTIAAAPTLQSGGTADTLRALHEAPVPLTGDLAAALRAAVERVAPDVRARDLVSLVHVLKDPALTESEVAPAAEVQAALFGRIEALRNEGRFRVSVADATELLAGAAAMRVELSAAQFDALTTIDRRMTTSKVMQLLRAAAQHGRRLCREAVVIQSRALELAASGAAPQHFPQLVEAAAALGVPITDAAAAQLRVACHQRVKKLDNKQVRAAVWCFWLRWSGLLASDHLAAMWLYERRHACQSSHPLDHRGRGSTAACGVPPARAEAGQQAGACGCVVWGCFELPCSVVWARSF